MSIVIIPRLSFSPSSLNETKINLINALTSARQMAMFSAKPNTQLQFVLSDNMMSIRNNNKVIKHLGNLYRGNINQQITHIPENLILNFNSVGETQKTKIILRSKTDEESLVIYSTGFIQ